MAKSKDDSRFKRSFSLPISKVSKGKRREQSAEERVEEEDKEAIHIALREIKALAVAAKKDFKKKRVYRMYCQELIDKWIPDLKTHLRITSREEQRHQEEAEAQEENRRKETDRDLRNFSKGFDRKRNHAEEIAILKKKHEEELAKQKREHEKAISKMKREREEEVNKYQDEKERLLTRLSQAAGDKLRQNNPAISDLSDPHRPTKLSEMFSELYDNEWTSAMDLLDSDRDEQKAVETLLKIQLKIFELCKGFAESKLSSLRIACCGKDNKDKEISTAADSKIKEMFKEMAPLAVSESHFFQEILQKLENNFGKDVVKKCKPFIQKSMECSWFMCVQDPPMHLVVWKSGQEMDNNCMKSFTKLGKFVDFSVWPALYLYKTGPLLSKGIVQGTDHTSV